jgi:hypothetical protein
LAKPLLLDKTYIFIAILSFFGKTFFFGLNLYVFSIARQKNYLSLAKEIFFLG